MAKDRPCFELVNARISYDRVTGDLRSRKTGEPAGSWDQSSTRIKIDGRTYMASHVCWLLATGGWPDGDVTFKNGNSGDLKFGNLSLTNAKERARKRDRNSKGFRRHGRRFRVQVGSKRETLITTWNEWDAKKWVRSLRKPRLDFSKVKSWVDRIKRGEPISRSDYYEDGWTPGFALARARAEAVALGGVDGIDPRLSPPEALALLPLIECLNEERQKPLLVIPGLEVHPEFAKKYMTGGPTHQTILKL